METNLSNSLGILIAFVTLMLIFSLVVTSLVQATQSILRLRSRNLWRGLTKILEQEGVADPSETAFKALAKSVPAVFSMLKDWDKTWSNLLGPAVSWLDANQLGAALRELQVINTEKIDKIVAKFDATKKSSSKRFQFWVSILTVIWSVIIVAHFQLSTPEILTRLSTEPEIRKFLNKTAEDLAKRAGASATVTETTVTEKAGTETTVTETTVTEKAGTEKKAIFYFPRDPERSFLFDFDKEAKEAWFGIKILWTDVPGAVLTVLLLSMGAPFWFNTLKSLVNLKDVLAKDKGTEEKKSTDTAKPDMADVNKQIDEVKQSIAKSADPLEQAALRVKLADLRVLKVKMRNI